MRKRANWDKEQSILSMRDEHNLLQEDWDRRQLQLGIPPDEDVLEMHEIVFLERFIELGNHCIWIAKQTKNHQPTNDFHWNETKLDMELKSMSSLKYRSISLRISDAAAKAARQGFIKENFIVDLGNSSLPEITPTTYPLQ